MSWNIEQLSNEYMTLEVVPALGGSVLGLKSASGQPVLREVDIQQVQTSSHCASFTLLPFSNRIREGRFSFAGKDYTLRAALPEPHARHGDVRNRSWQASRPEGRKLDQYCLACEFDSREVNDMNWPWAFVARVDYILHGPHLDISVMMTNVDQTVMPAGLGIHPYFAAKPAPRISFGAELIYDTDADCIPQQAARPLKPAEDFTQARPQGDHSFNHAYTAWDGLAFLEWDRRSLQMTADNVYSHLITYSAPDGSLALEPVSHATDAINLATRGVNGVDFRTLEPGQTLAGTVRLSLYGQW